MNNEYQKQINVAKKKLKQKDSLKDKIYKAFKSQQKKLEKVNKIKNV